LQLRRLGPDRGPRKVVSVVLTLVVLLGLLVIANLGTAGADSGSQGVPADSLTIKVGYFGGPYYTKKVYTVSALEAMPQVEQAYTYIDNMPAVVIDSGKGVKLADLLANSGIDVNSIEKFYFYSTDVKHGWYEDLDKSYLLDTDRYYYPDLPGHWDYGTESAVAGAVYGAVRVDTIIAYQDNWQRFATAPDFCVHDTSTRFRLLFGQTDTNTRTASRSVMWVHEIDVMLGGAPPGGIALDQSLVDVKVGSTFQLTATVTPGDATDKGVAWTSSDARVATVDNNGRVTVVGPGTASIAASTVAGNLTAICTVNGIDRSSDNRNVGTAGTGRSNGGRVGSGGSQVPDNGQQYLGKGGAVAAGAASRLLASQPWRVYEMSAGAVPLQLQQERGGLNIEVAVLLLALFILGLVRGYMRYVREVDR